MELQYRCPDCGHGHADPGEAGLGLLIRCLDCQIEVDLAAELTVVVIERAA